MPEYHGQFEYSKYEGFNKTYEHMYKQMVKEDLKPNNSMKKHPAPTWNPKGYHEEMNKVKTHEKIKKERIPTKAEIEAAERLEEELWNS